MSIGDFHARLDASSGDPLFGALAELRSAPEVRVPLGALGWPDWIAPDTTRGK